jgi:hypothetical protein
MASFGLNEAHAHIPSSQGMMVGNRGNSNSSDPKFVCDRQNFSVKSVRKGSASVFRQDSQALSLKHLWRLQPVPHTGDPAAIDFSDQVPDAGTHVVADPLWFDVRRVIRSID